jgi:two-component system response regulator PhcR
MDQSPDQTSTILYVDDEEMAGKYFMRSAGAEYDVIAVSSADAAVAVLRAKRGRIGVVVTDYRMPGRDGGDLLRQIEREYPHVVRILITAYADKALLLETVNSGEVFRILEKPLDLVEVRRALRMATELARERMANRQKLAAINETLAFLAHELNTPLATIVNFSRGIAQRASEDVPDLSACPPHQSADQYRREQMQHSRTCRAEVARAALSVNDNARYCLSVLSSFVDSVRNAGPGLLTDDGNAASQLVGSLLDTYPMTPEQRNLIALKVQQDFRITALPNCVTLVLSSLLFNALRALHGHNAPQLGIAIAVEAEPYIRISDNGPGIPPAILDRLLVDPVTTHAAAGGSGRGMIFCNRIMQSFGGFLRIESEPDQLTAITMIFPPLKPPGLRSA